MYSCVARMLLVCYSYVLVCYSCVTGMYSYVTRMYSYVTRMFSYVTRMYSYVLVCYSYVTRMYSCGVLVTILGNIVNYIYRILYIISLTLCLCRVGPHAKVLRIFEEWHVAFHGTQAKYLQPIFNNGAQLLMAGRFTNKLFSFVV
jgi:hypothetical protein